MDMQSLAALYETALLSTDGTLTVQEPPGPIFYNLPDEITLQLLLLEGLLGTDFTDDMNRPVRIISFGDWNRSAGPDFLNACVSIDERTVHGHIELDPAPEDWERHGHGANPNFNDVVLHLTCIPSGSEWFTRNARHERIPCACIPESRLAGIINKHAGGTPIRPCHCAAVLANQPAERIDTILKAAAAYRFRAKHRRFTLRATHAGRQQALFEALAETLGYHANKLAMRHLAMRSPLKSIKEAPEAILFGTAGFLIPVLSDTCTPEAVTHHKKLWEQWWPLRDKFELTAGRAFPWALSGSRPANHPQRRIGALALLAEQFTYFSKLCEPDQLKSLTKFLLSLRHPYWSTHVTLPSAPATHPMALMGRDRIQEFIINHVLPAAGTDAAWQAYLEAKPTHPNGVIQATHASILGKRDDAGRFLEKAWHHQALLQIKEDLCLHHKCPTCELLKRLG